MARSQGRSDRDRLAAILRSSRLAAGLRQADVAERLGQPQSFVSKYESGERALTLVELRDICQAVGVPLLDIVRRFEDHPGDA